MVESGVEVILSGVVADEGLLVEVKSVFVDAESVSVVVDCGAVGVVVKRVVEDSIEGSLDGFVVVELILSVKAVDDDAPVEAKVDTVEVSGLNIVVGTSVVDKEGVDVESVVA